jgi:hypothetical protein
MNESPLDYQEVIYLHLDCQEEKEKQLRIPIRLRSGQAFDYAQDDGLAGM